jgi:hypothetical protein
MLILLEMDLWENVLCKSDVPAITHLDFPHGSKRFTKKPIPFLQLINAFKAERDTALSSILASVRGESRYVHRKMPQMFYAY